MIHTAYNLATHPTLPLKTFNLLVKYQRDHGGALISGKDDHRAASEYMQAILGAIREKVTLIVGSMNFFSLLSGGSQAWKIGSDEELVLIRTEKERYTYIHSSKFTRDVGFWRY